MKIAYLVNHYPAISHSFIRREILALERLGHEVLRISVRGWADAQRGAEDQLEQARTRYVLRGGAVPLLVSFLRILATNPAGLLSRDRPDVEGRSAGRASPPRSSDLSVRGVSGGRCGCAAKRRSTCTFISEPILPKSRCWSANWEGRPGALPPTAPKNSTSRSSSRCRRKSGGLALSSRSVHSDEASSFAMSPIPIGPR